MRRTDDDDDDDDWDDDDADDGYIACPYCGQSIYEEAGYCPACERWISREDIPRKPLPTWVVVLVVICLAGLIFSALRLF